MAANQTEKVKINERISGFIQRNRRTLAICLGLVIIGAAGFISVYIVRDRLLEKSWNGYEEFVSRYESIKASFDGENPEAFFIKPDVADLREEIAEFAEKNSGFPAARAYGLIAGIYEDGKNWAGAEETWLKAAEAAPNVYFAPLSYFKAALAAEEQGRLSSAVEYYEEALKMSDVFPAAPRAQFAIGRIQEERGEKTAALESYRILVGRWPGDSLWGRLAQSRMLVLEVQ